MPGASSEETGPTAEEEEEKKTALWEIFEYVQPGDVIVVDGRGDLATGCFGEMLITFFKAHGGVGIVTDACVRDFAMLRELGLPIWSKGVTTGGAGHMNLFPWDFNVPIACGKVLVLPGDIIMADDGGPIVVPPALVPEILEVSREREEHEVFVRMKLREGGELTKYYPFNEEGQKEYEQWLAAYKKGKAGKE
jgi:regulator of RNase E activity RraA